jgi:ubiquitin C-terminal hydrolase
MNNSNNQTYTRNAFLNSEDEWVCPDCAIKHPDNYTPEVYEYDPEVHAFHSLCVECGDRMNGEEE